MGVENQLDYAQTLVRRDGPGDRARAIELSDAGLATAEELGMALLERSAATLRDELAARAPR